MIMKAKIENLVIDNMREQVEVLIEILCIISISEDENQLRKLMSLIHLKHPNFSKYFFYGFGSNHMWVKDVSNPNQRSIFVDFNE